MQRKVRKTIILLVVTMLLGGCGKKEDGKEKINQISVDSINSTNENEISKFQDDNTNAYGDASSKSLKCLYEQRVNEKCASSENGMYRMDTTVLANGEEACCMYYVDYASAQEIVLCNDVSCNHDTTDCMAIYTYEELSWIGNPVIFVANGRLYLLCQYDSSGSVEVSFLGEENSDINANTFKTKLISTKLDGTDRKIEYEFDDKYVLEENVYQMGDDILFISKSIEKKKDEYGRIRTDSVSKNMISFNTKTKEVKNVCELPLEFSILGVYDTTIVGFYTKYSEEYVESTGGYEDFDVWNEAYRNSSDHIVAVNIITGQKLTLFECGNNVMKDYAMLKDNLYVSGENNKVRVINIITGKETEMVINSDIEMRLVNTEMDRIQCWPMDSSEPYYWNPENNTVTKCDLRMNTTQFPMQILTGNGKEFVIIYDCVATPYDDGFELSGNKFAIINTEDFFNGINNYREVNMISDGSFY